MPVPAVLPPGVMTIEELDNVALKLRAVPAALVLTLENEAGQALGGVLVKVIVPGLFTLPSIRALTITPEKVPPVVASQLQDNVAVFPAAVKEIVNPVNLEFALVAPFNTFPKRYVLPLIKSTIFAGVGSVKF